MMKLSVVKPSSVAEKATRTTLDTLEITPAIVESWCRAGFQRPVRVNAKVHALAAEIRADGILPGIVTLGVIGSTRYLIDGQHRVEAFKISGLESAYADIRFFFCSDMAQMGDEFRRLNSRLVSMRPDDVLRSMEGSSEPLRLIRSRCKFVGYDMIRRGGNAPIVSMASALRAWRAATAEAPSAAGGAAADTASSLTVDEAERLADYLTLCMDAWGRDSQYQRLWTSLNLTLCAWLYRRLVMTQYSPKTPRLTKEQFRKCLMALSADDAHLDWLVNRNVGVRNNPPAYNRIKAIFAARLAVEFGKKPSLPQPEWASR
jgi:hypothetical protein